MNTNRIVLDLDCEIPHGHGLSYKRGLSDGLLSEQNYAKEIHQTHTASYERGRVVGEKLKEEVAKLVRK